jgi:hypothetical protein
VHAFERKPQGLVAKAVDGEPCDVAAWWTLDRLDVNVALGGTGAGTIAS